MSSSICSERRPEPACQAEAEHVEGDDPDEQGAEDGDPAAAAGEPHDQARVGEVADRARAAHRRLREEGGTRHRGPHQPCRRGRLPGACLELRRPRRRWPARPCGAARCEARGRRCRSACGPLRRRPSARASASRILSAARRCADAGARVALELLGARRDRALGEQLGLGLATADADGKLGRADAAAGAVGEEALDAAVLQRVEGDRAEAAADRRSRPRRAAERGRARRARR